MERSTHNILIAVATAFVLFVSIASVSAQGSSNASLDTQQNKKIMKNRGTLQPGLQNAPGTLERRGQGRAESSPNRSGSIDRQGATGQNGRTRGNLNRMRSRAPGGAASGACTGPGSKGRRGGGGSRDGGRR